MTDLLVVANEPLWPITNGGRARMAGLVEGLATHLNVAVAAPGTGEQGPAPVGMQAITLPAPTSHLLTSFVHWQPRLGRALLSQAARRRLAATIHDLRPRWLVVTHSYLAPIVRTVGPVHVVDFPNIEVSRMRSLALRARGIHRWSAELESLKARWWEPRAAATAPIALAVNDEEAAQLRAWGAQNVLVIPNLSPARTAWTPSPTDGAATFLASATYPPNRDAARYLLRDVWPLVLRRMPSARLSLVGRGMEALSNEAVGLSNVTVTGTVEDVTPILARAAVMLAPVTSGGGTQLKVIEALTFGRVVVASPYSASSAPEGTHGACFIADSAEGFAATIVKHLIDIDARHRFERELASRTDRTTTWGHVTAPLALALLTGEA